MVKFISLIGLISINYKTSPIEVREKFYFKENEKIKFYNHLFNEYPIDGLVILSTCNRTEIYYEFEKKLADEKKIFHLIMKCLVEFKHYSEGLSPYVLKKTGAINVSNHLFRLISGLESMIIGEFQIVDQLKDAFYFAKTNKMTGPLLSRLFQKSFETGKYIRSNTEIGKGAISVSYAAVEMISNKYNLLKSTILCIGASETSKLSIKHLIKKKIKKISISNRNKIKAKNFAKIFDLKTVPFDNFKSNIKHFDVVIFSTSSTDPIISSKEIDKIMFERKQKELLLVDLSVPRNIEPNNYNLKGLEVITIEGLKDVVNQNYKKRKSQIKKSEKLIEKFLIEFDSWASSRRLRSSIISINDQINKLVNVNYNNLTNGNSKNNITLNSKNKIHTKISDFLIKKIKDASKNGKDKNALKIIKKIFNYEK